MLETIKELYNIYPQQIFRIDNYDAVYDGYYLYVIVPVVEHEKDELPERHEMSKFLRLSGARFVPAFFPAKDDSFVQQWEKGHFLLLFLDQWKNTPLKSIPKSLANFHKRGMSLQSEIKKLRRLGEWHELWERRITQLKKFWEQVVTNRPVNEFERLFVESFPYYAGLTENAIQYFVDTRMDVQPGINDVGTITHERFTNETWSGEIIWRNPFDWVIDHISRDLAEWTRAFYLENNRFNYVSQIQVFFQQYEEKIPLSSFSWRLIYSRLILPTHFFAAAESYFYSQKRLPNKNMIQYLRKVMDSADDYELFLKNFFEIAGVPTRTGRIPQLDWLSTNQ